MFGTEKRNNQSGLNGQLIFFATVKAKGSNVLMDDLKFAVSARQGLKR